MKKKIKKPIQYGEWTPISKLGNGGNGEVWKCRDKTGQIGAIKLLKSIRPKSYERFLDEVKTIEANSDIEGILPIIDKFLPEEIEHANPYYVMPVAETAEKQIFNKGIEEKVNAIIQVAETLKELHSRGYSHRDIKPQNILFYEDRFCLADFGLVDYTDKKDVSNKNEEIGAKWTIAPEMKRISSSANGLMADVYSLAKTLWIILTENKKGFDGQYSTNSIIELKKFYPRVYTSPIDDILISSTDNDPSKRPEIGEFIQQLNHWKELNRNFEKKNKHQWLEVQTILFPASTPNTVIWTDLYDIIDVLKLACSFDNLNHMFYPTGGGLDLEDVRISHEKGCIELDFQLIDIVKPKRLIFESFGADPEWNYFRLELDDLEPSHLYDPDSLPDIPSAAYMEELSELSPGQYFDYEILNNRSDYVDEYPITDKSRHVSRWFKGAFVIFNKTSTYNRTPSTYDARHEQMSTEEFRDYIQRAVDHYRSVGDPLPGRRRQMIDRSA